jgi:hypothetical protein
MLLARNIWQVSFRSGRKHKVYPKKLSSNYRGITNQMNCKYINIFRVLYYKYCSKLVYDKIFAKNNLRA